MAIARVLHLLGIIIWLGGMFALHFAVRPAAAQLPPETRLKLLAELLRRFFVIVAASIIAIYASGGALVVYAGGMANVGTYVHTMIALATVMTVIFLYIVRGPYRVLSTAVAVGDFVLAARAMARIRLLVATNLALGFVLTGLVVVGRAGAA